MPFIKRCGRAVSRLWTNAGVARTTMKEAGRSMTKAMVQRGAGGAIIGGTISSVTGGEFQDGAVKGALIGVGSTAYKMAGLGKNIYRDGTTKIAKGAWKGWKGAYAATPYRWGKYTSGKITADEMLKKGSLKATANANPGVRKITKSVADKQGITEGQMVLAAVDDAKYAGAYTSLNKPYKAKGLNVKQKRVRKQVRKNMAARENMVKKLEQAEQLSFF